MDCHFLLQRIVEWVAISFSRGSFWPRGQTQASCIAGRFFIFWITREAPSIQMWREKANASLCASAQKQAETSPTVVANIWVFQESLWRSNDILLRRVGSGGDNMEGGKENSSQSEDCVRDCPLGACLCFLSIPSCCTPGHWFLPPAGLVAAKPHSQRDASALKEDLTYAWRSTLTYVYLRVVINSHCNQKGHGVRSLALPFSCVTRTSFSTSLISFFPLQCSCLENPRDRGACWAAVYRVTQSDTTEAT